MEEKGNSSRLEGKQTYGIQIAQAADPICRLSLRVDDPVSVHRTEIAASKIGHSSLPAGGQAKALNTMRFRAKSIRQLVAQSGSTLSPP